MSEAETNITPMHHIHHWKPPARPTPQPPSCFSELARLNQCYDDVQAMKQILSKVISDLMANDPAVVQSIIDAIQSHTGGATVPLVGSTDGSLAQPGQVGEFILQTSTGSLTVDTGTQTVGLSAMVLPPGDFDVQAWVDYGTTCNGGYFSPINTGTAIVQGNLGAWSVAGTPQVGILISSAIAQVVTKEPTLLVWNLSSVNVTNAGPFTFECCARRMR